MIIQLVILLVGILLALALPGGTVLFLMWIQSNRAKKQNSDRVEPIRPKSVRNFDTALANRVFGLPSFVLPSLFRIVFAKVPIAATEAQHMPGIYRATHFSNITDASTITEVRSNITALDIIKDVVLLPMCDF